MSALYLYRRHHYHHQHNNIATAINDNASNNKNDNDNGERHYNDKRLCACERFHIDGDFDKNSVREHSNISGYIYNYTYSVTSSTAASMNSKRLKTTTSSSEPVYVQYIMSD